MYSVHLQEYRTITNLFKGLKKKHIVVLHVPSESDICMVKGNSSSYIKINILHLLPNFIRV